MDRKIDLLIICFDNRNVALRKESVDRNHGLVNFIVQGIVALRKESVDRKIEKKQ